MKVIECDKCGKILDKGDKFYQEVDDFEMLMLDLCEECNAKQNELHKEFKEFYKNVESILRLSLKAKHEELKDKYFKKEGETK